MPNFVFERRVPACHVSKDLLSAVETYLKTQMCQKLGEVAGKKLNYEITIKEKIGTETLASIDEYTPDKFSDGTDEIIIRCKNEYTSPCQLNIALNFYGGSFHYSLSRLKVECTAPTARETANGIGDAIFRLLESHRTFNWVFNPFEAPVITIFSALVAFILLIIGSRVLLIDLERGLFFLSGCAFFGWIFSSGWYFKPFISFDTRHQQTLNSLWKFFSLGIFGFIVFEPLLTLWRKILVGF